MRRSVFSVAVLLFIGDFARGVDQCGAGEKRLNDTEACIPAQLFNYLYCLKNSSGGIVEFTKNADDAKSNSIDVKVSGGASGVVIRGNASGEISKSESARAASELQGKLSPDLAANCKSLADKLAPVRRESSPGDRTVVPSTTQSSPVEQHASESAVLESAAFQSATEKHTSADYREYLLRYGSGAHVAEVQRRLSQCKNIAHTETRNRTERVNSSETDSRGCYEAGIQADDDIAPQCESISGKTKGFSENDNVIVHIISHDRSRDGSSRMGCTVTDTATCKWVEQISTVTEACP